MELITIIFFTAQLIIVSVAVVKRRNNGQWRYTTRQLLIGMTFIAIATAMAARLTR